jgi:hypothetical protein
VAVSPDGKAVVMQRAGAVVRVQLPDLKKPER